jgi:hypothetical protein
MSPIAASAAAASISRVGTPIRGCDRTPRGHATSPTASLRQRGHRRSAAQAAAHQLSEFQMTSFAPLHHRLKTLDCGHDSNLQTRGIGPCSSQWPLWSLSRPRKALPQRPPGPGWLRAATPSCSDFPARLAAANRCDPISATAKTRKSLTDRGIQESRRIGMRFRSPGCVDRLRLFRRILPRPCKPPNSASGSSRCRDQSLPQLDCRRRGSR